MNEQPNNTKAILSLVFGILGVAGVCPCLGSVAAIALGWGETAGVGKAGLILGWIGLGLCLIAVAVWLVFFVVGAGVAIADH